MKTAVSLPDPLFAAAERMSKRLRISRSRLYALAVEAYLRTHEGKAITEALDAVYGTEESALDPLLASLQSFSLPPEEW